MRCELARFAITIVSLSLSLSLRLRIAPEYHMHSCNTNSIVVGTKAVNVAILCVIVRSETWMDDEPNECKRGERWIKKNIYITIFNTSGGRFSSTPRLLWYRCQIHTAEALLSAHPYYFIYTPPHFLFIPNAHQHDMCCVSRSLEPRMTSVSRLTHKGYLKRGLIIG